MTNKHIYFAQKWAQNITVKEFNTLPIHLKLQVQELNRKFIVKI